MPSLNLLSPHSFSDYSACAPGLLPSEDLLCELGATASSGAAGSEAGDLTPRVLSCPPESCLPSGCPGHEFAKKGVVGCLNTSAAEGAVFAIDFVVFSADAVPPAMAKATRVVQIGPPCKQGLFFCDGSCIKMSCADAAAAAAAAAAAGSPPPAQPPPLPPPPPTVSILAPQNVTVPYGQDAPGIAGCAGVVGAARRWPRCAAEAFEAEGGGRDITRRITVAQVGILPMPCPPPALSQVRASPDITVFARLMMTLAFAWIFLVIRSKGRRFLTTLVFPTHFKQRNACPPQCAPGVYTYAFSATSDAGGVAAATLAVRIAAQGTVALSAVVPASAQNASAAAAEAAAFVTSARAAELRASVCESLAAPDGTAWCSPEDVTVVSVTYVRNATAPADAGLQQTPSPYLLVRAPLCTQLAGCWHRCPDQSYAGLERCAGTCPHPVGVSVLTESVGSADNSHLTLTYGFVGVFLRPLLAECERGRNSVRHPVYSRPRGSRGRRRRLQSAPHPTVGEGAPRWERNSAAASSQSWGPVGRDGGIAPDEAAERPRPNQTGAEQHEANGVETAGRLNQQPF